MITIVDVKETLANSLIEISYSKPVNKITVQNITDNCSAARQTFYNHFKDKYDLINWIYQTKADEVLNAFTYDKSWYKCMKQTYSIFLENKQFFTKVIDLSGQNSFTDFFYEHTRDFFIDSIVERYGEEELTEDLLYSIEFNSYGQVEMCFKWIREGMNKSAEYMAKQNVRNIPHNLYKYLV